MTHAFNLTARTFDTAQPDTDNELEAPLGNLEETPLARLLLQFYQQRFSGTLVLRHQSTERRFLLERGAPFAFRATKASESLGGRLVAQGVVSPAEHGRTQQSDGGKPCADGVDHGPVTARTLFTHTRAHVRHFLIDSFRWNTGTWQIIAPEGPWTDARPLRIDPLPLIQSGIASHWSLERIFKELTPRLDGIPTPAASLAGVAHRLNADPCVNDLVAAIDGQRTLGEILAEVARSPLTVATIWLLEASGLIHVAQTQTQSEPTPATRSRQFSGAAKPSVAASGATPELTNGETLRNEILERLATPTSKDPYTILGVTRASSASEIRRAYLLAAKRYHPDTLGRLGLENIREQAAQLFSQVTWAWSQLGTERPRPARIPSSEAHHPVDADALLRAETLFQKGNILLRKGDFGGATQYLIAAVETQPNDATYQAALGWALHRHRPDAPERAIEHLQLARTLDPDQAGLTEKIDRVQALLPENSPVPSP